MKLAFHKPNAKNTGFLFGLETQESELYLQAIKQFSWNPETRSGSFKENAKSTDGKKIIVKFNATEAASILYTIYNLTVPYSTVHSTAAGKTVISVYSVEREVKAGDSMIKIPHLSFSLSKDGNRFAILLSPGEIKLLQLFLEKYIQESFS